jgi:hypothetical protein
MLWRAKRYADRRFPRSLASVRGEGMRSYRQPRAGAWRRCRGGSKLLEPLAAGKAMGCRVGAATPIGW